MLTVLNCKGAIRKEVHIEEALESIQDAIQLHATDRLERGEEIPSDDIELLRRFDNPVLLVKGDQTYSSMLPVARQRPPKVKA